MLYIALIYCIATADIFSARQPGVKFIVILDRRLDTWNSIKTALARIAVRDYNFYEIIIRLF